jgi:hypothetical protein
MKSSLLSLAMCLLLLVGKAQRTSEPELKEFEAFWKKFYTALVKKDYQSVSGFIEFPLVVKKSLTDTAVQTIGKDEFAHFFNDYLELPAKEEFANKYNLLRARKLLSDDDKSMVSDDAATIEDFEFQKVDGKWKLVYVYMLAQ